MLPLKLTPPPPRGEALPRPDLQALLAEVRLQPATLVVAPAGYGKTTLMTQWVAELQRTGAAVCWLGLDDGDCEPSLLLAYLVRTFQDRFEDVGQQAWRILHSGSNFERNWPLVAGALFSDLQTSLIIPTFLFIDDIHLIADGPITDSLLGYLLRVAPPSLHIVLASRRPISVAPLPRLRAEGALIEVFQHDLSLNVGEARTLLERYNVQLDDEALDLLLDRTEGWALSLQLVARTLARQPAEQRLEYLRTIETYQQDLFDYLASEALADLPSDLLDFLSLTAVPDQFDAAMLNEVLDQSNSEQMIAQAQHMGLPLTPLNERGTLLRFHPLWRNLLLKRARNRLDDEAWNAMQRLFGRAQERLSNLEAALEHFAEAGATDELARALREHAWPLLNTPRREAIRRWLAQIPASIRDSDPELLHMWGWSQPMADLDQATQAISAAAELYRAQGAHQRELRALSDLAMLHFWDDWPDTFIAVCKRAVRAANKARDAWARGASLVSVVAVLYSRGRYSAALRVAARAVSQPRSPFWQWLQSLILSSIYLQQGRPSAALTSVNEALIVPQIDRDDRLRQHLLRQKAQALFLQGFGNEAIDLALQTHHRLSDFASDGVIGSSAASLAFLLLAQGRLDEATTYLARARSAANRSGARALLTRVQALETFLEFQTGQVDSAMESALALVRQTRIDTPGRSDSAQAQYSFLNSHDLWMRLLFVIIFGEGGEIERARLQVQDLISLMQARKDGLFLVLANLYAAALASRAGDATARDAALRAGWSLAELQGYGFFPLLPFATIHDAVVEALHYGLAPNSSASILRRQLHNDATPLLLKILEDASSVDIRTRITALLGDLGATGAYSTLRGLLKDRNSQVRSEAEAALERLVYRPSYRLHVRMLGAFSVWRGEEEIRDRDWRSIKARQLLQLLITERGRMLSRDQIMDTLWPGLEMDAAANNLRVTLSRLTKALEPERPEGAPSHYIIQHSDTYGFNTQSDHQFDIIDFADSVAHGRQAEHAQNPIEAIAAYRQAVDLYGGVLLPDSLYEDWSVVERERLGLLFNEAALRLGSLLLEQNATHEAIGLAWRVLEYDQAQEEAYRLLMQAYAHLGERSTALRLYARCVSALQSELGVPPLPETVTLYDEIRKN